MAKFEETITIKLSEGVLEVLNEVRESLRLIGLLLVRNEDRPVQVCLNCGYRFRVEADSKREPCCQNQHVITFGKLELPKEQQAEAE